MADFLNNISYQLVGIIIVIGALSLLGVAVWIVGRMIQASESRIISALKPVQTTKDRAQDTVETIPPEILAVLAAAVVTVLKGPHRIVEIHTAVDDRLQAWSLEGRRQIFSSHRVR